MAQLLSNLSVGSKVKFGNYQVGTEALLPIGWIIVAKNHSGYPSNSVTLLTNAIIDLRAYDGTENGYSMGNFNFALSNIHQWLNSDKGAGNWYTAAHTSDTPPSNSYTSKSTGYESRPGFLYKFTEAEKNEILPTTITIQKNLDVSTKLTTKVFLPSTKELVAQGKTADGSSQFAYFSSCGAGCCLTPQAYNNTSSTKKGTAYSTNWEYWTRNNWETSTTNEGEIYTIDEYGDRDASEANDGSIGVRPVVNLASSTWVTDTPDSDGYYTVLAHIPPTISETNSDLGVQDVGFSQTYTVNDADGDTVIVKEYIDNIEVHSFEATPGATNTFDVTGETWVKLANGAHTLKIVAADAFDESTRTFTFTKSVSSLVVQRTTPMISYTMPKSIIVSVVKNIPTEATFKVEACNNGFDAEEDRVWEDITWNVLNGEPYDFANASKKVGEWGVNIRVTVERNGAEGACYITEIGGNFE